MENKWLSKKKKKNVRRSYWAKHTHRQIDEAHTSVSASLLAAKIQNQQKQVQYTNAASEWSLIWYVCDTIAVRFSVYW